jgi:tetratricopeptide (TPR) repeat protein
MRLYQHIVDLCPDSNDALVMESRIEIIMADVNLGDDPNALADFNELIADFNDVHSLPRKLASKGDEFFYRNDYPKAIAIWEMVLTKYPGRKPNYLAYVLGTSYERLKDYATAIKYYEQSVEKYPNCIYAYRVPYRLGILYRRVKNYEKSVYWFGRQSKLYSHAGMSQRALFFQGVVYLFDMEKYELAAALFQEYVQRYPEARNAPVALYDLALCREKAGDKGEAIALLETAISLYSGSNYIKDINKKLVELKEEK